MINNLSNRRKQVLELICDGYDNVTIAQELHISQHTVSNHIQKIFDTLGTTSRTQATKIYYDYIIDQLYNELSTHVADDVLDPIFNEVK